MSTTIDLENLSERLTLTDDADPATWPGMEIEIEATSWDPPEPDVGIFCSTLTDWEVTYTFQGDVCRDHDAFALAIHNAIGKDIAETVEQLSSILDKMIQDELDKMEPESDW